jgi:hypothetical protein
VKGVTSLWDRVLKVNIICRKNALAIAWQTESNYRELAGGITANNLEIAACDWMLP